MGVIHTKQMLRSEEVCTIGILLMTETVLSGVGRILVVYNMQSGISFGWNVCKGNTTLYWQFSNLYY